LPSPNKYNQLNTQLNTHNAIYHFNFPSELTSKLNSIYADYINTTDGDICNLKNILSTHQK